MKAWAALYAEARRTLRPGDVLVLALGALAVALAIGLSARSGITEKVVVRAGGQIVAELDPRLTRQLAVRGPLGETRIEIAAGRARVASDPSPRQLCVKQGWLEAAGELAVCLPNEVSLEMVGRSRRYDSLAY
jgi:hypothetical protein